jgi:hypothetical protein
MNKVEPKDLQWVTDRMAARLDQLNTVPREVRWGILHAESNYWMMANAPEAAIVPIFLAHYLAENDQVVPKPYGVPDDVTPQNLLDFMDWLMGQHPDALALSFCAVTEADRLLVVSMTPDKRWSEWKCVVRGQYVLGDWVCTAKSESDSDAPLTSL